MNLDIDNALATFSITEVGQVTKQTYSGSFTVKTVLSPMDRIKADRLYRELLGATAPSMASSDASDAAFAISQLQVRVVKHPQGFLSEEGLMGANWDMNVIITILNKAIEAQDEYNTQQDLLINTLQNRLKTYVVNNKPEEAETDENE